MIFQCNACHRQSSVIAGTVFQGSNLPLTTGFLALYLISQAKTEREDHNLLTGSVQLDEAYLGGERSGGLGGRRGPSEPRKIDPGIRFYHRGD